MRLELILEEPSAEAAMRQIMPKIVRQRARVSYINMRNKSRLLQALPARLLGYRELIGGGADIRIVTVTIKRIHGTTVTVVPAGADKAFFVDAKCLHNNLMPYT